MHTPAQIAHAHTGVQISREWISPREKDFVKSLYWLSRDPAFPGLTAKQDNWLSAIERKLETRHRYVMARIGRRQRAYAGVCASW